MKRLNSIVILAAVILLGASCIESDTKAPNVVETSPVSGSIDVDPSTREIIVTFDEPMKDGNWSWAYSDEDKFPEMTGQPYYKPGHTINILPVKLESNKEYEI